MKNRLSAVVVVHDEEGQLRDCLARLDFADELVVVLDRCGDRSRDIAGEYGATLVEGSWPLEGPRRHAGIAACSGDWILEVDADERVGEDLATEIREAIAKAEDGYFLIPVDNYIGDRLVRHGWGGSFGASSVARLFARGGKKWGTQRVHPEVVLAGPRRRLNAPLKHLVDRDVSDMLARLDRYTTLRAMDLRESGDIGGLGRNLRRMFSRFYKCYVSRRGYREGAWGLLIALLAGLYPILSHLKARLEPGRAE